MKKKGLVIRFSHIIHAIIGSYFTDRFFYCPSKIYQNLGTAQFISTNTSEISFSSIQLFNLPSYHTYSQTSLTQFDQNQIRKEKQIPVRYQSLRKEIIAKMVILSD